MVELRKVPVIYTESSRDFHEIPFDCEHRRVAQIKSEITNAFRWGDESAYQPQPRAGRGAPRLTATASASAPMCIDVVPF